MYRTIFLLPMAISFIATAIVWRWLLDNGSGAETTGINRLLAGIGLGFLRGDWHRSEGAFAVAAVALPAGWALSGYVMVLFLAGLRTIPDTAREAARVDGATELQVFWHVTRPLLRAATLSAVVILLHISLKTLTCCTRSTHAASRLIHRRCTCGSPRSTAASTAVAPPSRPFCSLAWRWS